jgi:hypothetical protein
MEEVIRILIASPHYSMQQINICLEFPRIVEEEIRGSLNFQRCSW